MKIQPRLTLSYENQQEVGDLLVAKINQKVARS